MSVSSPRLVSMAIGEKVDLEELGGWRLHAEITELRETKNPDQGLTVMRYEVVNQRNETVMTFDMKFLMHRRERGQERV